MNISALARYGRKYVVDNSPQILTAMGVAGVISTALLTGKASYKACEIIEHDLALKSVQDPQYPDHTIKEKIDLTWKLYIPAAGTGMFTIAAIVGSNRISSSRAAGLAAAFSLSERAFEEYSAKVLEKMGPKKEQAVRDEIAQDQVKRNPVTTELVILGTDVPCYDSYSGRYFSSSMERIRKAENDLNFMLLHEGCASLSEFYDMLGLTPTEHSSSVGWSSDGQLELYVSTVISEDQRPCLAINFRTPPAPRYNRYY